MSAANDLTATNNTKAAKDANYIYTCVARDGTYFSPHLKRKRGFWIGRKGEEKYIENFTDALSELLKMTPPSWRRPNAAGNWGIVTGIEWKYIYVSE